MIAFDFGADGRDRGKIEDIKQAAESLSVAELAELRAWLDDLEEQRSDEQIASGLYSRLSLEQRAELAVGIADADRGEGLPEDEVFDRLEKQLDAKRE